MQMLVIGSYREVQGSVFVNLPMDQIDQKSHVINYKLQVTSCLLLVATMKYKEVRKYLSQSPHGAN